jgi:hypothetical protein
MYRLLGCLVALWFAITPAAANQTEAAKAFEQLVQILQEHGGKDWWDDSALSEKVASLASAAKFDAVLHHTLVKFNKKNKSTLIVTIMKNEILISKDELVTEQVVSLEQALETLYGINKL